MEELQDPFTQASATKESFPGYRFRIMERRLRRRKMNQKRKLSSSIGSATFMSTIALALMICGASAGKLFAAAADSL